MRWREETEEETAAREAEWNAVYVRCRTCHFGSIETEFGEDQCPDCSSTMFVPIKKCVHGWIDGHYEGEYIDYSHGDQRRYSVWCPGAEIGGSNVPK